MKVFLLETFDDLLKKLTNNGSERICYETIRSAEIKEAVKLLKYKKHWVGKAKIDGKLCSMYEFEDNPLDDEFNFIELTDDLTRKIILEKSKLKCYSCGNCCKGQTNTVVFEEEKNEICQHLGKKEEDLFHNCGSYYTPRTIIGFSEAYKMDFLSDISKQSLEHCIFLKCTNKCIIQSVKPFWCKEVYCENNDSDLYNEYKNKKLFSSFSDFWE